MFFEDALILSTVKECLRDLGNRGGNKTVKRGNKTTPKEILESSVRKRLRIIPF